MMIIHLVGAIWLLVDDVGLCLSFTDVGCRDVSSLILGGHGFSVGKNVRTSC